VVPTWNAALVYDTEAGVEVALEILEFANSQLLQFRYYDDLLDAELARTYAQVQAPRWYDVIGGRRYTRAAHHLHAVFIDVNELTDRTENALKIVGDIYAARLFALVAARLGWIAGRPASSTNCRRSTIFTGLRSSRRASGAGSFSSSRSC
jgi:hypothetical protein